MSKTKRTKYYVTTPIYYGTAQPHIGSLYSTLLADVVARWNKLKGSDVFFLTGTDEHGQKIAEAASKAGSTPCDFVDRFVVEYKKTWHAYEIEYDVFMRTTDHYHVAAVQQWIVALQKKGDIYKSIYKGWYCIPDETFVTEKDLQTSAGGAPLCPSCSRPTQSVDEETYFFRLSAYQDKLLDWYKHNPEWIVPKERLNEIINFVSSGLKDLSISRKTVTWGIPFPGDAQHVVYVWADALNNYITAVGYGQKEKAADFVYWWPADLQIMGKDIMRFHAIYWPAFLMASGLELPKKLLVHGWIKMNDQKMSKSLGNAVDPMDLLQTYGADAVRYYLMRKMAIAHDSPFSIEDLQVTITADLANDLGNLLSRMVTLAQKNNLHELSSPTMWSEHARVLHKECQEAITEFDAYMNECSFHMALARLWQYIKAVNAYFHASQPWKLSSEQKAEFEEIIAATAQSLRVVGFLLWPFMPAKMAELLAALGIRFDKKQVLLADLNVEVWNSRFVFVKIAPLFSKFEKMVTMVENNVSKDSVEVDNTITIDDVVKVELLVGTIEQCQEVEKSDKLLKLSVNFGPKGVRTIFSGIKKDFASQDLIGKQSIFVYNLKPRKMLGMESQGMMMLAKDASGKLQMVSPVGLVENGTRLA